MLNKKKKLVFEKSITRDWPLFIVQMLHKGFTKEFEKQFKFRYLEVLFDCFSDHLDIYRAPIEHIEKMRAFILNNLRRNPNFIREVAKKLIDYFENFKDIIHEIDNKSLVVTSNKELSQIIKAFIKAHQELEPCFVMMFWFPIQMENHQNKEKYKPDIDIAAKMRAKTEKVGPEGDRIARKLSEEVSRRMFGNKDFAKFISLKETHAFLTKNKKVNKKIIEKRKKGFIYGALGIKYIKLSDYAKLEGLEVKTTLADINNNYIKGSIAYKGYVKGKVRIIISKKNIKTLKNGEILVTAMTTPEFVPAMKKAAAIITDEGGITCHAAIVARELKIPCVIGTKVATKVLKDGDQVEVDATKGIVRILK